MDVRQPFPLLSQLTFRQAIWLFPLAFTLHVVEEWPGFVAWANRYASASFTRQDYLVIHLSGVIIAVLVAALLRRYQPRTLVLACFAFLLLPGLFWNVFFHVGATIVFRAYCPGVITAVLLYPPVVYLLSRSAYRQGLLSRRAWLGAVLGAGVFHTWEVGHNVFKAW